jgi:hypothetical protein
MYYFWIAYYIRYNPLGCCRHAVVVWVCRTLVATQAKLRERRPIPSQTIPLFQSDFPALRNTTRNGSSPASAGPRIHSGWPSGSPPRSICDLECGYSTLAADAPPPRSSSTANSAFRSGPQICGSVPRRTVRESAMRESKTAFSPCMLTPGRYPSATNSSTSSCRLIPSITTGPTICTSTTSPDS